MFVVHLKNKDVDFWLTCTTWTFNLDGCDKFKTKSEAENAANKAAFYMPFSLLGKIRIKKL